MLKEATALSRRRLNLSTNSGLLSGYDLPSSALKPT
jgi:hypothetical protein